MVCRMGKGVAPIPAGGHCWGDAAANPDLKMENEVTPAVADDTYEVSDPFIENAFST